MYRDFHYTPSPYSCTVSPIITIPRQSSTFFFNWWTYIKIPQSPKVYSLHYGKLFYGTFCESGPMYNDIYPSLWNHIIWVYCPIKSSVSSLVTSTCLSNPGNHSFFYCLHSFASSDNHIVLLHFLFSFVLHFSS